MGVVERMIQTLHGQKPTIVKGGGSSRVWCLEEKHVKATEKRKGERQRTREENGKFKTIATISGAS